MRSGSSPLVANRTIRLRQGNGRVVDTVTEDAGAREFVRRHLDELLYCHGHGAWFRWVGSHWEREGTGMALDYARAVAHDLSEGVESKGRAAVRNSKFAGGIVRFAQADRSFAVKADTWDTDPFLLGTPDGTVELKSGVLRPARPEDRITRVTAVGPTPAATCPTWLKFLDDITRSDQGLIEFLRAWFGYCLTGDTREHAILFCYGGGGNGKSVLINTLRGILGDYSITAAMDSFAASQNDRHPTDLAMLRGARLVTASETEEGRQWAEARIKQMTGGDPITARFMRRDYFTYQPQFKLTIIGNHKPSLKNVDDAARRRFNIVPFERKPTNPDRQLEEKLRAEWPAILRWMIDGCLAWQKEGLRRPEVMILATEDYFSDQDCLGQWIDEECEAEPANQSKSELVSELFSAWSRYAKGAGEDPGSKKSFSGAMARRGFGKRRGHRGVRFITGVRLKPRAGQDWSLAAHDER